MLLLSLLLLAFFLEMAHQGVPVFDRLDNPVDPIWVTLCWGELGGIKLDSSADWVGHKGRVLMVYIAIRVLDRGHLGLWWTRRAFRRVVGEESRPDLVQGWASRWWRGEFDDLWQDCVWIFAPWHRRAGRVRIKTRIDESFVDIRAVGTEQIDKEGFLALVHGMVRRGESAVLDVLWCCPEAHIVYTDVCLGRSVDAGSDSGRRICHGLRQIGSITVHHAWFRLELGIIWRNCVCKRNGRRADPGPIEANRRELGRISFGVYPV